MKGRTLSVADREGLRDATHFLLKFQPQTQPRSQLVVKKTFLIRWLAIAALLFVYAIAAHAQYSVPVPPSPYEYDFDDYLRQPVRQNVCWAYTHNYDLLSLCTVDQPISVARCAEMQFPFPPPPAGPPYQFTSYTDCVNQQKLYFTQVGPDHDGPPCFVMWKEEYASMIAGGFTCTAAMKANPYLVPHFVKTYPPPNWPF